MKKLCPFRKETNYVSGRATEFGYPDVWEAREEFYECLEEKCMMWCKFDTPAAEAFGADGWCKLEK